MIPVINWHRNDAIVHDFYIRALFILLEEKFYWKSL